MVFCVQSTTFSFFFVTFRSYALYFSFSDNILSFIPYRLYPIVSFWSDMTLMFSSVVDFFVLSQLLLGLILLLTFLPFNLLYRSARYWFISTAVSIAGCGGKER